MARSADDSSPVPPALSAGPEPRPLAGTATAAGRPVPYGTVWPPPPSRPRRERIGLRGAIVAIVVVAVVLVGGLALLAWAAANERFTCPGVEWTVHYNGSGSGYFGTSPQTGCLGYPTTGTDGYEITVLLTLTNAAPSTSHQVSSISVASPSTLNLIAPALPITLPPGRSANLTLEVTIPTLKGDYVVHGVIDTS
jgi:hypothetical protein